MAKVRLLEMESEREVPQTAGGWKVVFFSNIALREYEKPDQSLTSEGTFYNGKALPENVFKSEDVQPITQLISNVQILHQTKSVLLKVYRCRQNFIV